MKKLLWLLLTLGIGMGAGALLLAQTPPNGTHTGINSSWTPPAGQACSSTVAKSCIAGYTETLIPPTGVTGTNTVPPCSATVTTNCIAAAAVSYLWKPGGNLYCGTWKISLVANWLSDTGAATASAAATTTAVEPCPFVASPATGFIATPQ